MENLQVSIERIIAYEKKYGSSPSGMCYGMGYWLKKYLSIPNFIPLNAETDHGVYLLDEPSQCQLKTDLPIFVTRESQRLELLKYSKKSYVVGSPFVHYRRLNQVEVIRDAKGTVCFPVHSTHLIDTIFDWQKYAEDLLRLPEQFQPLSICMYWKDLLENRHEPFISNGIKVVTAGHMADQDFTKNFYQILSSHRYSTSNQVSSCTFYSVEMGIPFFLYGQSPLFNNFGGDHNRPSGIFDPSTKFYDSGTAEHFTFSSLDRVILTSEVKDIANQKLGLISSTVNRNQIRKVILFSAFKGLIRHQSTRISNKIKYLKTILSSNIEVINQNIYSIKYNLLKDNKIPTHLTINEKILINKIIRKYRSRMRRPMVCVEIGSFLGASSCFIANAISEKSRLYCIDTWGNHAMQYCDKDTEGERDTYSEFKQNTLNYKDRIIEIRKWSVDAVDILKQYEQKIDFLFIDGNHNHESVKNDWELYSPLLCTGSIVAFHDTGWAEGVNKVIADMVIGNSKKIAELPNIQFFRVEI